MCISSVRVDALLGHSHHLTMAAPWTDAQLCMIFDELFGSYEGGVVGAIPTLDERFARYASLIYSMRLTLRTRFSRATCTDVVPAAFHKAFAQAEAATLPQRTLMGTGDNQRVFETKTTQLADVRVAFRAIIHRITQHPNLTDAELLALLATDDDPMNACTLATHNLRL